MHFHFRIKKPEEFPYLSYSPYKYAIEVIKESENFLMKAFFLIVLLLDFIVYFIEIINIQFTPSYIDALTIYQ